jgi:hypothetical protein
MVFSLNLFGHSLIVTLLFMFLIEGSTSLYASEPQIIEKKEDSNDAEKNQNKQKIQYPPIHPKNETTDSLHDSEQLRKTCPLDCYDRDPPHKKVD